MNNPIPENKRLLAGVIAATALFLIYIIFIYMPKHKLVNKLKIDLKHMDEQIEYTQKQLGEFKKLGPALASMEIKMASFNKRITRKKQTSSRILAELSELAKLFSIKIVSIEPQSPVQVLNNENQPISINNNLLKSMKIRLSFQSSYKAAAEYVKNIQDNLNVSATIDEIEIVKGKNVAPALSVTLALNVYLLE